MPTKLLLPGDPPPVVVENPGGASDLLLLGDHAGRAVPARLGDLGLSPAEMDLHIAWDIGIEGLGRRLAKRLDACFIRQSYSRLVIDCNRALSDRGSMAPVSDGVAIPGNLGLSGEDAERRAAEIFHPYHSTIAAELGARQARGQIPVIVALHSFTPTMAGRARPWRFGILHREDSAFSRAMLETLRASIGDEVGDNEPYRMDDVDFTVPFHADGRGLDYLEIEIRQDLLATFGGQARVAAELGSALEATLRAVAAKKNSDSRA